MEKKDSKSLLKPDRLKSRKVIDSLFESGQSQKKYPLLFVYHASDFVAESTEGLEHSPIQIAFSVSKRRFRRAVDRNRIKRLLREAFRLNSASLSKLAAEENIFLQGMFLYIGKEEEAFAFIEKKMLLLLEMLEKSLLEKE